MAEHTNNYPKLHNATWPGVVGKGSPDSEPIIALDIETMVEELGHTVTGVARTHREAMALVEELRRPDQRVEHTIQTNGTLLDDEWAAFFAEHLG